MYKKQRKLVPFTLAMCMLAVACNTASASQASLNSASLSPSQVVKDYYKYISKHNVQSASQFVAPDVAKFYRSAPDSDFNNVKSISHVVVTKSYNISLNNEYKSEVQVDATYMADYKRVISVPNGGQTRFIYLGRNKPSQPWLIISIGTGP